MNVVKRLRKIYSYFRWRLKAPRYVGKFVRSQLGSRRPTARPVRLDSNELYEGLQARGFSALRNTPFHLPEIDIAPFAGKAQGVPFYNALPLHWERLKPLICEFLLDPRMADVLVRYFDGKPWLWNAALNYSEANKDNSGAQESQLWHFDYGDVKQLHAMLYFSDVSTDCGPFTFFPAEVSDKVTRSSFEIERFTDENLKEQFGIDVASAIRLTGKRQDCFIADPGRTMHQGARCDKPRLVLFLTFTTPTPMSAGGSLTLGAAERRDLYRQYRNSAGAMAIFEEQFFL